MVTKEKMDELRSRYVNARNEREREDVRMEIKAACDEDAASVADVAVEQIKETICEAKAEVVRKQMEEILPMTSLAYIAKTYFKKSRQWLYQRINGTTVNGKPAQFTKEELAQLNFALQDMGQKLMQTVIS